MASSITKIISIASTLALHLTPSFSNTAITRTFLPATRNHLPNSHTIECHPTADSGLPRMTDIGPRLDLSSCTSKITYPTEFPTLDDFSHLSVSVKSSRLLSLLSQRPLSGVSRIWTHVQNISSPSAHVTNLTQRVKGLKSLGIQLKSGM